MADPWIAPILTQFVTLLKDVTTGLNVKIAEISADVQPVDATAYRKANTIMPPRLPWVSVFSYGDSLVEFRGIGECVFISFPVYVTLDIFARDEEHLHYLTDVYNTAIVRAIVQTGDWNLGGTVDVLNLQSLGQVGIEAESGNIVGGCYSRWEVSSEFEPGVSV